MTSFASEKHMVSINMITYNHEPFIAQAIEGVVMQKTNFSIELVIGEDCSTDSTRKICEDYAIKYPEIIRILPSEQNLGMSQNGIRTLQECKGKYIALCEGDDYWTDPLKLQKQFDFLEENEEYSLCFTRFKTLQQNTKTIKDDSNTRYFEENDLSIDFNFEIFAKGWHVGTQTLLYRKEMFDMNEISNYKYFRDVHLFTELLKKGKGVCLNFFGSIYRLHDGGIHSSIDNLVALKTGTLCYEELYYKNKNIDTLKIKYYNFQNEYFKMLVQKSRYRLAFVKLALFFLREKKCFVFKNGLVYILKNIFKKLKRKLR